MRTRRLLIFAALICISLGQLVPIANSAFPKASGKHQSNIDLSYNRAVEASEAGNYKEANLILLETWAAFNASVKTGLLLKTNEVMIVDLLRFTAGQIGQINEAMFYSNYLLQKFSQQVSEKFVEHLKNAITVYELEVEAKKKLTEINKLDTVDYAKKMMERKDYASCRTKNLPKLQRDVFCRVDDRHRHPLLVLSPVREEILSTDPAIILFHDLVTPSEVETFQTESKSMLRFAANDVPGKDGTLESFGDVDYRKAAVAWLLQDPVPKLTRRLSAIVGLSVSDDAAESYQVSTYNVGGHIMPHFDAPVDDEYQPPKYANANTLYSFMGKRLATLMIYLNDVEEGGSTTFPFIGFSAQPKYRAGLFWYNLYRNDTTIYNTYHAGCPILKGEKWIVNKWFRAKGQIFTRPCPLDRTLINYNVDINSDMQIS